MEINKQTILLEKTVDYVNGLYHLDTKYNVTQFRAGEKAIAITLDNGSNELAIKIKGQPKYDLEMSVLDTLMDLGLVEEVESELEEQE